MESVVLLHLRSSAVSGEVSAGDRGPQASLVGTIFNRHY